MRTCFSFNIPVLWLSSQLPNPRTKEMKLTSMWILGKCLPHMCAWASLLYIDILFMLLSSLSDSVLAGNWPDNSTEFPEYALAERRRGIRDQYQHAHSLCDRRGMSRRRMSNPSLGLPCSRSALYVQVKHPGINTSLSLTLVELTPLRAIRPKYLAFIYMKVFQLMNVVLRNGVGD